MLRDKSENVCQCNNEENNPCACDCASVNVNVDVTKIVSYAAIAGVLIVGIVFGCITYRKVNDL